MNLPNNHPCLEAALANWEMNREGQILYDGDHAVFVYKGVASDQNGKYRGPLDNMLPLEEEFLATIKAMFCDLTPDFRRLLDSYFAAKGGS